LVVTKLKPAHCACLAVPFGAYEDDGEVQDDMNTDSI
jgi:hypothetical protein